MSDSRLTGVPFSRYPDPTKSGLEYAGDANGWFLYQNAFRGLWTPTLTATTTNPTLGSNPIQFGEYILFAGWVTARFKLAFGTGMTGGSGTYELGGLPEAPDVTEIDGSVPVGKVHLRDVGTASKFWTCVITTGGVVRFNDDNGVEVTNTVPWTWGNSDNMRGELIYRTAED